MSDGATKTKRRPVKPAIVKPVDAAGLVLIRQGRGEPEILLGRRHGKSGFLPDIYVAPGGRVDAADHHPSGFPERLHPIVTAELASGGSRRPPLAFPRAALRETFEETGLLIGKPGKGDPPGNAPQAIWQAYRDHRLAPDFAGIDFLCRAITPVYSRRRYNTRFFLADGSLSNGEIRGNGELEDLAWRRESELRHLNIVDVTQYVLAEALRRWRGRHQIGSQSPRLLNYRNDIMLLSRHRRRMS